MPTQLKLNENRNDENLPKIDNLDTSIKTMRGNKISYIMVSSYTI